VTVLLYLARHGQTSDNAKRIFQGQAGSGLDRLGRAQASRLAERIKRSARPPNVIVSSDLDRAAETARIVGQAINIDDVELDPMFREVDVGTWTGKSYDDVAHLFPEEWAAWDQGLDVRRGGGETYGELALRIDKAIEQVATRHDHKRILVVSHGGSIKSWISKIVLGVSADGIRALGGIHNTSLTVVENDSRGRWRLHSWNDTAHLEGLNADETPTD
jgi:broad specificity phosphatase PhoE